MVHVRLNEREINPNPHINFITALPMPDAADQEEARQLLRALAAQVRPVMKAHGFVVNSFEEASGAFSSISWLMSTLCHEVCRSGRCCDI
ncbi:uncharacterized protein B0H18DRAFT_1000690 [Fomitopsis serialis]|uniref:uncharacterized protein n=1 Tax=Fomitopsis serialis TaxID=139415 RepID=UPI002007646F|nr:uncharacterized protein B0H18DRAFT_1000690 [Neoantrodia serialis]KAH9928296.1 hypothetical protein B0H18DRAFT_1000690 [Neoantrodia serialis]